MLESNLSGTKDFAGSDAKCTALFLYRSLENKSDKLREFEGWPSRCKIKSLGLQREENLYV